MPDRASDLRCERPHHRPGRYPAQTDGAIAHTIAGESIPCELRLGDSATRRLGDLATEPAGSGLPIGQDAPVVACRRVGHPLLRRVRRNRHRGGPAGGGARGGAAWAPGPVDRRRGHQHYRYGWVGGKRRTRRRPSCRFRSRLGCLSSALAPALAHLHQHYWYRYVQTPADSRSSMLPPPAPGSAASARRPAPIALVRWRRPGVEVGPGKP